MPNDPYTTESYCDAVLEPVETQQRQRNESSYLIDLRRQPRYDVQVPAEAVTEHGEPVHVFITNISLSGMRLEDGLPMLTALFQETEPLAEHNPTLVQVFFTLPDASGQLAPVKVQCRSVYTRCERENNYQVGLEIRSFTEGQAAYTAYLKQREAAD
jgi:hypothetical protein